MTEIAVVFVVLSLFLYVVLGGADFGAGIIENFTGKKGKESLTKAIAPVWEANHIWLVVIIVVLFNAFPSVYSTVTLYLHIPLLLILLGLIFRGTSFTFRYYDPYEDRSHKLYTRLYRVFSIFTPFFLGVTFGATALGKLSLDGTGSFQEQFIYPWFNAFSMATGLFVVVIFALLAAVYMTGEPLEKGTRDIFVRYTRRLLIALLVSGALVFIGAQIDGLKLFSGFLDSWIAIGSILVVIGLSRLLLYSINKKWSLLSRIIVGAQAANILIGYVAVQYPDMVVLKGSQNLTVEYAKASPSSINAMVIALFIGLAVVIPLLVYLFKVYKFQEEKAE
ncbi:MAG: cytochrome d ubiquinol oxidase subunit II [Bacteroidales bacterium]|nr:cytochrome d ubiquinol oxidase subunit II [Bacteroidales bacterium]